MAALPSGTVTFLFTDIEGSTRLLHELGDRYVQVLAEHRRALRDAVTEHHGVEVDTQGDAFFIAFASAPDAVAAAHAAQRAMAGSPVHVRMGIHTGEPTVTPEGYVGIDVHRGARVCAAGHGGQVLLSLMTRRLIGADVELRDLGEHRLKDLKEPEWLFQLVAPDLEVHFPPLRSLSNTNLPVETSPLIGRGHELAELGTALDREAVRLLTLTGPGGTGKTRLALRLAADRVEHFKNGVFLVALGTVIDPARVLATIAQTLGVKEAPRETIAESLRRHLEGKQMLLVLDNFEQVLAAAPEVGQILASTPQLKVIVTSRERLRLAAEHEFAIGPLPEGDAVALFDHRARAVKPAFRVDAEWAPVMAICRRLDGLPLAVELAAARVKLLSPEALLAGLERRLPILTGGPRDHPQRQQTLRATIDWSYELLNEKEQRIFAALGVFIGGCTFEAAETICGADLETIASLLDKSLIRHEKDRYLMFETIHEYASERLESSGARDALERQHTAYYCAYAQEARAYSTGFGRPRSNVAVPDPPEIRSAKQAVWLDRLAEDHDNMRVVLQRLVAHEDSSRAADLIFGIHGFWRDRGLLREGRAWTERVLALVGVDTLDDFGALLTVAGEFPRWQGDLVRAKSLKEEAIRRLRKAGKRGALAATLHDLGDITGQQGDYVHSRTLHEESLAIRREVGEPGGIGHALNGLAVLLLAVGEFELAEASAEEAITLDLLAGATLEAVSAKHTLAEIVRKRGQLHRAVALYTEALAVSHRFGKLGEVAECLDGVADVAAAKGDFRRATLLWAASQRLLTQTGQRPWDAEGATKGKEAAQLKMGSALFHAAWQAGETMSLEEAVAYATETAKAVEGHIETLHKPRETIG